MRAICHPGADGDPRRDQLHGPPRPRPDLPRADQGARRRSSGCSRWRAPTAAATRPPSPSRSRRATAFRPESAPPTARAPSRSRSMSANGPEALVSPGHVFPLVARPGGVLVRAGHTEAAVDVARLAGLNPSGVICEIMREDGTMARLDDLMDFARAHGLKIGTIRDLIAYRLKKDHLVERVADDPLHRAPRRRMAGAGVPRQGDRRRAAGAGPRRARPRPAGAGPDAQPRPVRRRARRSQRARRAAGRRDADDRGGRLGRRRRAPRRRARLAVARGRPPLGQAAEAARRCAATASARRSSPRSASTT